MMIGFKVLWLLLAGQVIYDAAIIAIGWFPSHTARERVAEEFAIAWFIAAAWLFSKLFLRSPQASDVESK